MARTITITEGAEFWHEFPLGMSNGVGNNYQAAVHFSPIKIDGVTVENFGVSSLEDIAGLFTGNGEESLDDVVIDDNGKKGLETITRTDADPSANTGQHVTLYLPQAFQLNEGVQYENIDLGAIGAGAAAALSGGQSLLQAGAAGVRRGAGGMVDAIKGNLSGEFGALIANRMASATPAGAGVSSATRLATNPNTRSLFKNVNQRRFTFTFQMIPESQEEAIQIEKIIEFFRTELYPEEIGVGQVGLGYRFPNMMDISITHSENFDNIITKILPCYLNDVAVQYNTQGMSFHKDGRFTDVSMTLNFTEYRPLNKQDVQYEYKRYLRRG